MVAEAQVLEPWHGLGQVEVIVIVHSVEAEVPVGVEAVKLVYYKSSPVAAANQRDCYSSQEPFVHYYTRFGKPLPRSLIKAIYHL